MLRALESEHRLILLQLFTIDSHSTRSFHHVSVVISAGGSGDAAAQNRDGART